MTSRAEKALAIDLAAAETQAALVLALDVEMNGDAKMFAYGATAYVRCYHEPESAVLSLAVSDGRVDPVGPGVAVITETVLFTATDEARLDLPVRELVEWAWLGRPLGGITPMGGRVVRAARSGVAAARVTYRSAYTRLAVRLPQRADAEQSVLAAAFLTAPGRSFDPAHPDPDRVRASAFLTLDFYDPHAGSGSWRSIAMRVVDACSGDPLAETPISLEGAAVGVRDENGRIDLGLLREGSEHTLSVIRAGYREFSDAFTVPEVADA